MGILDEEPKDEAEMRKDTDAWLSKMSGLSSILDFAKFQTGHILDLCKATGYTREIEKLYLVLEELDRNRKTDISTFRDQCHTSMYTGTKSVKPSCPWFEAFDDSLEAFLGN